MSCIYEICSRSTHTVQTEIEKWYEFGKLNNEQTDSTTDERRLQFATTLLRTVTCTVQAHPHLFP